MSLFRANGPEDAPRPDETPVLEGALGSGPASGEEREAPLRRVPHIGHALVFISFTGVLLVLLELVLAALGRAPGTEHGGVATLLHPKMQLATMAATYLSSLLAAWFFFPLLW